MEAPLAAAGPGQNRRRRAAPAPFPLQRKKYVKKALTRGLQLCYAPSVRNLIFQPYKDRMTGSGETGYGAEGERKNSQAKGPGHDDAL